MVGLFHLGLVGNGSYPHQWEAIHMHIILHIYIYMYVYAYVYIYMYMYTYVYVYIYVTYGSSFLRGLHIAKYRKPQINEPKVICQSHLYGWCWFEAGPFWGSKQKGRIPRKSLKAGFGGSKVVEISILFLVIPKKFRIEAEQIDWDFSHDPTKRTRLVRDPTRNQFP